MRSLALAFKKNHFLTFCKYSNLNKKMEESFKKEISGFRCKFMLEKQTLHITCLSPDQAYQLSGSFSTDNIPENIKNTLCQSAQEVYGSIQRSACMHIEENQIHVGYEIGLRTKFFKLPLVRKDADKKDITITKLKKENDRKYNPLCFYS